MRTRASRAWVLLSVVLLAVAGGMAGCRSAGIGPSAPLASTPEEDLLRVGVTPTGPPMIFYGEGEYRGLDAEMAHGLAAALGKKLVFVELKWEDLIPALRDGRIDIIMSGMSITAERLRVVAFSDPYLRLGQLALVRKADLALYDSRESVVLTRKKVGVEKATTGDELVLSQFLYAERVPFSSIERAADALIAEEVDMVVCDAPLIWWLVAVKEAYDVVAVPGLLNLEYLGWAVRHEDQALLAAANQFLSGSKANGKLDDAVERWMPPMG